MEACDHCGFDLSSCTDIPIDGGAVGGMGSLYVSGTFRCPECRNKLRYDAKVCSGYPKRT